MELDTGGTLSIISKKLKLIYQSLFSPHVAPHDLLKSSTAQLITYIGEVLRILGEINATVCYMDQKSDQSLLVVSGDGPSLIRAVTD